MSEKNWKRILVMRYYGFDEQRDGSLKQYDFKKHYCGYYKDKSKMAEINPFHETGINSLGRRYSHNCVCEKNCTEEVYI